jgi:hypothetical protein
VRKRLKKKDLTFDDFCKRMKRVKRVKRTSGRGMPRHYKGEDQGKRKRSLNGGAGCNEQTQGIIACDYWFVKSKVDMKICSLVKY